MASNLFFYSKSFLKIFANESINKLEQAAEPIVL